MLRPNRNRLTLTGQDYYGSSEHQKARQPSGASAPQPPQNSGLPGTSNIQKPTQLQRPLAGQQSQIKPGKPINYYGTPSATSLSQSGQSGQLAGSKPTGGPVATSNQQRHPMSWDGSTDPYGRTSGYMNRMPQYQQQSPQMGQEDLYGQQKQTQPAANPTASPAANPAANPAATPTANAPAQSPATASTQSPAKPDPLAQAQQYYADTRNLKNTGTPDYSDFNFKTELKNQRIQENDASMQAELARQQAGKSAQLLDGQGLKYRQSSTGFGTPEQAAQAGGDFSNMATGETAKKDAYNAQQDALMAKHSSDMNAYNTKAQGQLGIEDMAQTKRDMTKLAAEYNVFQKANSPSGRMSFKDFVQAKVNAGEMQSGSDLLKLVQSNYGPIANPKPTADPASEQQSKIADLYKAGNTKVGEWKDARAAAREGGYAPGMSDAQREGLDQRREQAAEQAETRSEIAGLRSQGYNPAQASAIAARNKAIADYYGQQEKIQTNALDAQKDIADKQVEAKTADRDWQGTEAEKERQLKKDLADKELEAGKLNKDLTLSEAEKDRQLKRELAQQKAQQAQGTSKPTDSSKPNSGAPQDQKSPKVQSAVSSLKADKNFKPNDPNSLAQAGRHLAGQGLSQDEMIDGLGQIYGADFRDPSVATGTIANLGKNAFDAAKKDPKLNSFEAGKRAEAMVMESIDTIKALGYASGLSPDEIATQVYPEPKFSFGTFDPYLKERRQRLIDALAPQENESAE